MDHLDIGDRKEFEELRIWMKANMPETFSLVRSGAQVGPGAIRNRITESVATPFVAFFDDDNLAGPRLMEVWSRLTRFSVDAVSCGFRIFLDEDGEFKDGAEVVFLGDCNQVDIHSNCFGDSASLFRREALIAA
ncbi:MAG: hypothetical protein V4692_16250, partial [Bdellovibrionota bacterium]